MLRRWADDSLQDGWTKEDRGQRAEDGGQSSEKEINILRCPRFED